MDLTREFTNLDGAAMVVDNSNRETGPLSWTQSCHNVRDIPWVFPNQRKTRASLFVKFVHCVFICFLVSDL